VFNAFLDQYSGFNVGFNICEELNNSPQIEQQQQQMAGRLPDTRRIRLVTVRRGWRTREFGVQGWRMKEW